METKADHLETCETLVHDLFFFSVPSNEALREGAETHYCLGVFHISITAPPCTVDKHVAFF